jgi:hypothetical protein
MAFWRIPEGQKALRRSDLVDLCMSISLSPLEQSRQSLPIHNNTGVQNGHISLIDMIIMCTWEACGCAADSLLRTAPHF